jgi:Txe/YoeB family toxin of toxin-antitoxin system
VYNTKSALKDLKRLESSSLKNTAKRLIQLIKENPYQSPPLYEKLRGDLQGSYSRRINHKHRLVYQVCGEEKAIKILGLWNHYDDN